MKDKLQKIMQEIFGKLPDKVNIIPGNIPIDVQIEYFQTSLRAKENINYELVLQNHNWLFDNNVSIYDKKFLLAQLASIPRPEAYRIIERYLTNPDAELANWARLAYIESRTLLESELLNEQHVIISSGLGGENNLLRYFVALKIMNDNITEGQKKLFELEAQSVIEAHQGKIEEISINFPYIKILLLVNYNDNLSEIFKKLISKCKEYQLNINEKFIVTNVRKLDDKEIGHFLNKIINEES